MKTDEFGRHEILDRTGVIIDLVSSGLLEHDQLKKDEEVLARAAFDKLFELYQLVGSRHIPDEAG